MKIEIGESLMRSWLRHVIGCEFAELNWKPSPTWEIDYKKAENLFKQAISLWPEAFGKNTLSQLIKQSEVDVIGLALRETLPTIYLIDVAYHAGGLNYGSKEKTAERIIKKIIRSILVGKLYFPGYRIQVSFVSPFIGNALNATIEEAMIKVQSLIKNDNTVKIECIFGQNFQETILEEVLMLKSEVSDTSELFLRSWQLIQPFQKKANAIETGQQLTKGSQEPRTKIRLDDSSKKDLMITALYMSKFEHRALEIGNQSETFKELAKRLGVPTNTLKNERDFFDRHIENHRQGWDVPLTDARRDILKKFGDFDENTMRQYLPGYK